MEFIGKYSTIVYVCVRVCVCVCVCVCVYSFLESGIKLLNIRKGCWKYKGILKMGKQSINNEYFIQMIKKRKEKKKRAVSDAKGTQLHYYLCC